MEQPDKTRPISWKERPQAATPHFVVLRHAERADAVWQEGGWCQTAEDERWPNDPPLSPQGVLEARSTCLEISKKYAASAEKHVVVSSPYKRCWQTAVEVCLAIGPSARLMIDYSIGEVYGPDVFGDVEPVKHLRPRRELLAHCRASGVKLRKNMVGKMPAWPEFTAQARARLLEHFLKYLHRSAVAKRNFTLVMHAHGVTTALGAMPAMSGRQVEHVGFSGYFVAFLPPKFLQKSVEDHEECPFEAEKSHTSKEDGLHEDEDKFSSFNGMCSPSCFCTTRGWQVHVSSNVRLGARVQERLVKRVSRWSRQTSFNETSIQKLLRCPPDFSDRQIGTPHSDCFYDGEATTLSRQVTLSSDSAFDRQISKFSESSFEKQISKCSDTTFAFGASDFSDNTPTSPTSPISPNVPSPVYPAHAAFQSDSLQTHCAPLSRSLSMKVDSCPDFQQLLLQGGSDSPSSSSPTPDGLQLSQSPLLRRRRAKEAAGRKALDPGKFCSDPGRDVDDNAKEPTDAKCGGAENECPEPVRFSTAPPAPDADTWVFASDPGINIQPAGETSDSLNQDADIKDTGSTSTAKPGLPNLNKLIKKTLKKLNSVDGNTGANESGSAIREVSPPVQESSRAPFDVTVAEEPEDQGIISSDSSLVSEDLTSGLQDVLEENAGESEDPGKMSSYTCPHAEPCKPLLCNPAQEDKARGA